MRHGHQTDIEILGQISVLCVEDEELTRKDVVDLLRPLVARVVSAANGQLGVYEFAKCRPDVVIADIRMPVLDGLGLAAAIREMDPDIPIVFTTAAEDRESMVAAINAGAGGYLLKPVDPIALVRGLAVQGRIALSRKELAKERRLGILLRESIPFPVMILDLSRGVIATANASARRLGFVEGQTLGGPMFPEPVLARLRDVDAFFIHGEDVVRHGQHAALGRIFEVSHRPITADLAFFMAEDVTERKRLEQLREDVERIGRHDLKSPLNVVVNLPEVMLEDLPPNSPEADHLRTIRQAGLKMLDLINLSLDLYKMETGGYRLDPRPVDILEVLSRAASEQDVLVRAKRLWLEIDVAQGPDRHGPMGAAGEEFLLQSMFANLLRNAAEASPDGGAVDVTVIPGDPLEVRIHNAGAVPPEVRDTFFEKYATARKKGGTGLGTHSAWLIATAHHGSIGFETSQAEGTTVWVKLPAA